MTEIDLQFLCAHYLSVPQPRLGVVVARGAAEPLLLQREVPPGAIIGNLETMHD